MLDLSQYRILVVDDEPDDLDFICTVLEDQGATVLKAHDGDAALEVARREKPDLMTLDLAMPGKDGCQVFDQMRQDPCLTTIPVCIITGRPELRQLIYQRTVRPPEGYLDKPLDDKRLLMNVRRILSLFRREDAQGGPSV